MKEPAIHLFNDSVRGAVIVARYLPLDGDVEISVRKGEREPLYVSFDPSKATFAGAAGVTTEHIGRNYLIARERPGNVLPWIDPLIFNQIVRQARALKGEPSTPAGRFHGGGILHAGSRAMHQPS
jgi:hypothetical protein